MIWMYWNYLLKGPIPKHPLPLPLSPTPFFCTCIYEGRGVHIVVRREHESFKKNLDTAAGFIPMKSAQWCMKQKSWTLPRSSLFVVGPIEYTHQRLPPTKRAYFRCTQPTSRLPKCLRTTWLKLCQNSQLKYSIFTRFFQILFYNVNFWEKRSFWASITWFGQHKSVALFIETLDWGVGRGWGHMVLQLEMFLSDAYFTFYNKHLLMCWCLERKIVFDDLWMTVLHFLKHVSGVFLPFNGIWLLKFDLSPVAEYLVPLL